MNNNLDEMQWIIENTFIDIKNNMRIYKDSLGYIGIDINKGIIYRLDNNYNIKRNYITDSKRVSGHVAFKLYIGTNKEMHGCHQHDLILMSKDVESYKRFRYNNISPVGCHIDNCPWHNSASNLEWGTVSDNNKHGKLVKSLHYYYPFKYTKAVSNNNKNIKYIQLLEGIKNDYISEFRANNNNKVLNIINKYKVFNLNEIDQFIDFMYGNYYWSF